MSETERKHRHRRKSKRHEKSWIRDFYFEIFIGLMFLLGVFLLFEQMEIKSFLYHGIVNTFQAVSKWFNNRLNNIMATISSVEVSDIVGIFIIFLAFILLIYRVRQKSIWRYSELSSCPECGGDIYPIHRNIVQRLASRMFFLKIRRYHCKDCSYDGLRIRSKHSR